MTVKGAWTRTTRRVCHDAEKAIRSRGRRYTRRPRAVTFCRTAVYARTPEHVIQQTSPPSHAMPSEQTTIRVILRLIERQCE